MKTIKVLLFLSISLISSASFSKVHEADFDCTVDQKYGVTSDATGKLLGSFEYDDEKIDPSFKSAMWLSYQGSAKFNYSVSLAGELYEGNVSTPFSRIMFLKERPSIYSWIAFPKEGAVDVIALNTGVGIDFKDVLVGLELNGQKFGFSCNLSQIK